MPTVLCRVDAGGIRGLGHLQRCLALSQALKQQQVPVVFLAPALTEVQRRIDCEECEFVPFTVAATEAGGQADVVLTLAVARAKDCHVVVVDSYDIDDTYLATLRSAGHVVVAIDDLVRHPFSAHIVVNGGAGADEQPYRSVTGDTRFFLGPRYALLDSAFWNARTRAVAPHVGRVLVAVGGGDPHRSLPRILDVLDSVSASFDIVAVQGPFAPVELGETRQYSHRVEFVHAPHHLHDVIVGVDLAVSAAGQTLYELAATGTPTVAVQVFDNQEANLQHLAAAGAVRCGGCVTDADFDVRLLFALNDVVENHVERVRMSDRGQRLVDGRGAIRVAEAVAAVA